MVYTLFTILGLSILPPTAKREMYIARKTIKNSETVELKDAPAFDELPTEEYKFQQFLPVSSLKFYQVFHPQPK